MGDRAELALQLTTGLRAFQPGLDDDVIRLQLLESQAGVQYRQGRYAGALRTLEQIIDRTEGSGCRSGRSRSSGSLPHVFHRLRLFHRLAVVLWRG